MRVLLVDDHPQCRDGMAKLLDTHSETEGIETASTITEARQRLGSGPPDLLVTDWSLPDGSGLDLIRWVRERWPDLPVLVVSMHREVEYASKAREAGADGYLRKTRAASQLLDAAWQVARGGTYLGAPPHSSDQKGS